MGRTVAVVSCAHVHTVGYLRTLAKQDDITTVLWDDFAERAARHAEPHGFEVTGDLDAFASREDVAGFLVCAENTRHRELIDRVAERGLPIFCEKPLAITADDCAALVAVAEKVPFQVGYHMRAGGIQRTTKAVVDSGRLGRILFARCRQAHHGAYARYFDSDDAAWFADKALAGGGGLMDLGCHAIDQLVWHLGPVRRVAAATQDFPSDYPIDQFGVLTLEFESGALGTIDTGWTSPRGAPSSTEIFGEVGYVGPLAGREGQWIISSKNGTGEPVYEQAKAPDGDEPPTDRPIQRFIKMVRGETTEPTVTAAEAAHVSAILDAAYRAADEGKWINV